MDLPTPELLISLALITTAAYAVYGLTGFGAAVTGMPFMLILIPLHIAVPVMMVHGLFAGALIGIRTRRHADLGELRILLPYLIIGLILGTTILVQIPEKYLLLLLGAFLLGYSGWSLLFRPVSKPIAVAWAAPLGIIGGIFSGIFGTGGAIYTVFLVRRIQDKNVLRATTSLLVLIAALFRLLMLLLTGFFSRDNVLQLIILLLPFVFLGLYLGNHFHRRTSLRRIMQTIWLILIVAGINVIRQGLAR